MVDHFAVQRVVNKILDIIVCSKSNGTLSANSTAWGKNATKRFQFICGQKSADYCIDLVYMECNGVATYRDNKSFILKHSYNISQV